MSNVVLLIIVFVIAAIKSVMDNKKKAAAAPPPEQQPDTDEMPTPDPSPFPDIEQTILEELFGETPKKNAQPEPPIIIADAQPIVPKPEPAPMPKAPVFEPKATSPKPEIKPGIDRKTENLQESASAQIEMTPEEMKKAIIYAAILQRPDY